MPTSDHSHFGAEVTNTQQQAALPYYHLAKATEDVSPLQETQDTSHTEAYLQPEAKVPGSAVLGVLPLVLAAGDPR